MSTPDTNPLPPLDDATDAALRDSIQRYGVLVPIVCDVDGNLIDGHHRLRILEELRVTHDEDGPFHDPPSVIIVAPEGWREAYPPSGTRVSAKWREEHPPLHWRLDRGLGIPVHWLNPIITVDPYEPEHIIQTLNLDRRQLTSKQREAVIVHLRENGHSVRAIAAALQGSRRVRQLRTSSNCPLVDS